MRPPAPLQLVVLLALIATTWAARQSGAVRLHISQAARAPSVSILQAQPSVPNTRIALPALGPDTCEITISIQNVGDARAKAMLVLWGDPSPTAPCNQPAKAAGPMKAECTGLLRPGTTWQFQRALLPAGARGALAYALNATDVFTDAMGHRMSFADTVCSSAFAVVAGS